MTVVLNGVAKSYGPVRAVRDIDLTIPGGGLVALLGPNGAGKSTTIGMLAGLIAPDAGTVTVCDLSPSAAVRAGRIAVMLQDAGLMPGVTVRELVGLAHDLYPYRWGIDEALPLADLTDVAGRRVDRLSGGQTQRLRFALVAVANTDVLALDEPTPALDVAGRREFWTTIRGYARSGRTVLFATHYLDAVEENADRVIVMVAGRIVADGTPDEVRRHTGQSVLRLRCSSAAALASLPGVSTVDCCGDIVVLRSTDATVRSLASIPGWRDGPALGMATFAVLGAAARCALDLVRAAARQAGPELRAALGPLRTSDLSPAPGLDSLESLLSPVRTDGLTVHCDLSPGALTTQSSSPRTGSCRSR